MHADRRALIVAYLRLPHALPVIVVLATTAALVLAVDRHVAPGRFAAILLAMLGAQLVIGIVNELVDLELDRAARPDKPLVSGLISRRAAVTMLGGGAALMLAAGATLGPVPLALCLAGCAIGIAYSLWCKRTVFAVLPYLLALPLLPIWVAVALDEFEPAWLTLYPLGWSAVLGVQIAQSLPDVATDRTAGIVSLTTLLGERRSLRLCWFAVALAAIVIGIGGFAERPSRFAAAAVLLGLLLHAALTRRNRVAGVRAAFPVAAASTALLGLAWVVGIAS